MSAGGDTLPRMSDDVLSVIPSDPYWRPARGDLTADELGRVARALGHPVRTVLAPI